MDYRELSNEQRRQFLDFMQVDELLREKSRELSTRFSGSMRWLTRGDKDYLHVKRGRTEKSLGERSKETERVYANFFKGREKLSKLVESLKTKIDSMAPVNRALGLGRVPKLTSLILRALEKEDLLGSHLLIAGTNAMWAYEAKAGIQFQSDIVATMDADMLWDPRIGIKLLPAGFSDRGILQVLRRVDKTFSPRGKDDFRAFNKDGFSVDLIRPEHNMFFKNSQNTLSGKKGDLTGAPIFGLHWLLNAPRLTARTIAEDGYSVPIATFDPRAFCLHKLWLSARKDRDPLKAKRDAVQATLVAKIATTFLNLEFDHEELRALPAKLRAKISQLKGR